MKYENFKPAIYISLIFFLGLTACKKENSEPAAETEPAKQDAKAEYKDLKELDLDELKALVEKGDIDATSELGVRLFMDEGVESNLMEGFTYVKKAAEGGHINAMYNAAVMYQHGYGVEEDMETSFSWYKKAAEKGHGEAARFTALMYKLGEGAERNYAEALKWFHVAADKGVEVVYSSIGILYYTGQGTEQDYVRAREWYLKAAENGDANAYLPLTMIYSSGLGTPIDKNEADKWVKLTDASGKAAGIPLEFRMTLVKDNPDYLYDLALVLWNADRKGEALYEMDYAARAGSRKAEEWLETNDK